MSAVSSYDKLADIMVERGRLSEKDRDRLIQLQRRSGKSFVNVLWEEKLLDENLLLNFLSEVLDLPIFHLESYEIDREAVRFLPQKMAERYETVPIAKIGSILTLAVSKPLDLMALDDLRELTGCEVRQVLAPSSEIKNALSARYAGSNVLRQVLKEVDSVEIEVVAQREEGPVAAAVDDAPVVRMVNLILQEAVRQRASDIHLEPYRDHFRIRYRIDGILKESLRQSLEIYPALIARIKILSNLDITERRVPQDGRFKIHVGDREIDFRVSMLPTFFGEKGVLRLLDKANVRSGLDELGFSPEPIQAFKLAIRRPYGMILVTGPTGSGKSTTLYSVLNLLNVPDRNLMTIEDPIEYQVEGITQTQVNSEVGLTFSSGLRSLLRQSPDVVLVGEIRDAETADIAVKAALTGHLVLSTLHTNSACGAVTRLIDMGVEPFLIASSVILVGGQRLLRRICPYCKTPSAVPVEVLQRFGIPPSSLREIVSYRGRGCHKCNETGYLGRLGAVEVMQVDSDVREAILNRSSSDTIENMARKKGMETLFENAFGLFKTGKTTLEEVLRVTRSE